MKIASSDILLTSSHALATQHSIKESLRAWIGDSRPNFDGQQAETKSAQTAAPVNTVQISDAGKNASEADAIQASDDAAENDPKVQLIKSLIEFLLGKKIKLFHASDLQAPSNSAQAKCQPPAGTPDQTPATPASSKKAGWGVEYSYHEAITQTEQTSFQASGVIRTADNQEIKFNLSLDLQRSYHEESDVSIRGGDAQKIDPLVLNFSGNSAQLSSQQFAFDLNADGTKENISFVQGAGLLALDKNGDGKINDGKELFGPATGNGFAELAALDSDKNGWIDENDAAYQQLKVWTKDASGADHLSSLAQAKVGALFLGNASTPFALNDAQNKPQAQLVSSGLWLTEDGKVNTMQQIDLVA